KASNTLSVLNGCHPCSNLQLMLPWEIGYWPVFWRFDPGALVRATTVSAGVGAPFGRQTRGVDASSGHSQGMGWLQRVPLSRVASSAVLRRVRLWFFLGVGASHQGPAPALEHTV